MFTRGRFTLIASVAFLALVRAAPEPGANDIQQSKKTHNVIITKPDTTIKPPVPRFVNERYPHAVLFGTTCGGSIISPTWILTAAHCTLFTNGRYVLAGTNNTDDDTGVTRRVKRTIIHPLFTVGPYWLDADEFNIKQVAAHYDFLLVELETPLEFNDKIKAAPLNERLDLPPGLEVGYAGYGTDHHGGVMRSEMHGMDLAIRADKDCSDNLPQYTKEDMVCSQGVAPNFDSACNGDSGSGLVDKNGRLIGVLSWLQDDARVCEKGKLVIASKVAAVRKWIKEVTNI